MSDRTRGLINLRDRTPEQRREIAAAGGRAAAAARKERKTFKEDFLAALETPGTQAAVIRGMLEKAAAGDVAALRLITELIGENGTNKTDINVVSEETARRDAWNALTAANGESTTE